MRRKQVLALFIAFALASAWLPALTANAEFLKAVPLMLTSTFLFMQAHIQMLHQQLKETLSKSINTMLPLHKRKTEQLQL